MTSGVLITVVESEEIPIWQCMKDSKTKRRTQ